MRSVLGAPGCLARESRPDLPETVSILQSRFNRAQVSDIQETNRVVRLSHRSRTACLQNSCGSKSVLCLTVMPAVGAHVLDKHKLGT